MKITSPQLGFNNNVKHKGRLFHVQTEDSGLRRPHVITHLFADGGRILKTTKTSYAEHVESPNVVETVIAMMKEQHKAMFVALRDGEFDHLFASSTTRASIPVPAVAPEPAPAVAPEPAPAPEPSTSATQPAAARAPEPAKVAPKPATEAAPRVASASERTAATVPELTAQPRPSLDLALDLHALERAAAATARSSYRPSHGLPPPPAALFERKPPLGSTTHSAVRDDRPASVDRLAPTRPLPRPHSEAPRPAPRPTPNPTPGGGRYAISRPASIFATTRSPDEASIFGEELISEKSLDEVILSYLADDLDPPPAKK